MEDFTASDHQYISFEIQHERQPPGEANRPKPRGWNLNKLNKEQFIQVLMMGQGAILAKPRRAGSKEDAEKQVSEVMTLFKKACDASMPRKRFNGKNPPMSWWNPEISELRRQNHKTQRRTTRAKSREEASEFMKVRTEVKHSLRQAINVSKIRCERKLCLEVDKEKASRRCCNPVF